ncbi:MAG: hypothetical protein LC785_18310 [Acidobacteria bacterium]|nr:hypothetical protein [Acidobacteriota bacterium]
MSPTTAQAEALAQAFLDKALELNAEIELIRALKARAYHIGRANVLIRTASLTGIRSRYFFGLNYITAEEVANLDNPFFAFVCGAIERTLIVPASVLLAHLPLISHDRNGEYKLNIDQDLNIVLAGHRNRLECANYVNNWDSLLSPAKVVGEKSTAEQSYHTVLQGRLLEIGKVRGYQTFCPNKSKRFNDKLLGEIATLARCPNLQFSDYDVLRQIDVLWFQEKGKNLLPECAFEVELSTGTWSGVGRMATLLDYSNTRLYVISNNSRRYKQVMNSFADFESRYRYIPTEALGDIYSAELNLRELLTKYEL